MRTSIPKVRHILNLETCISVVAAFFYSQFMERIKKSKDTIDYKKINVTRYTDWAHYYSYAFGSCPCYPL